MHRLAETQLKRATNEDGTVDIGRLMDLVSQAYEESDRDRRRTDRSIGLMIEELDGQNYRLEELVATRTADLEQMSQKLEATLANTDQGIVMIGEDGRVAVFNDGFLKFTGLDRSECADNPHFSTLINRLIERGEFDPMGDQFKTWAREAGGFTGVDSFQRTRPDGTILRVKATRLPGGGEVRTLTDITELVRRAAEIESVNTTLEATLSNVSQGIMKIDAEHRIVVFNSRVEELLGLPNGFLKHGMPFQALLDYQIERGEFSNMPPEFLAFVRSGGVSLAEQTYIRHRPNGTILDVRTIPIQSGGAVRTFTDITEQTAREQKLRQAEAEIRSLFDNATIGIYRTTIDGKMLRANPSLARLNGFDTPEEMVNAINHEPKRWYVQNERRQEFVTAMARDGRVNDFVSEVYRYKTGEKIWVSEAAWLVRDADGQPLYYEGMVTDATDRKLAEDELAHVALHDVLTGLPNRSLFIRTLTSLLERRGKAGETAVMCLDLDHFKDVNDTMGHDAGDRLLQMAGKRLQKLVPQHGLVARFGGDEFAVIAPGITDRAFVARLAQDIVRALSRPFRIRGKRVYVGASIGMAFGPGDGHQPADLLKKADIALYRAKRDGRGCYLEYDIAMSAAIVARREVEMELRRAIEAREFRTFYQPIVDLETMSPISYEALVRWQHPTKGLLAPGHFIEIAEDSGLIAQIGELVLKEACSAFARIPGDATVSVNLSPVQFRNQNLAFSVLNALASSGLPARRLVLEITETVLLTDDDRTLEILRQLRMLGVRIALDDFGIGHSSLSYLQKFQFDKIKIDRSFVQSSNDGTLNTAIRRAILGLGHDLGIDVVVEGVETPLQRDMLIYEGARYAQGYLWGKPQPIDAYGFVLSEEPTSVRVLPADFRAA